MKYHVTPTNHELVMRNEDFIISKTDTKGLITYTNRIFIEFAKYTEDELLGKQHNIVRHPDMPRAIFKLLWSTIQSGKELFAYIKNLSKDGSFYWVYANVTPVYDVNKKLIGYFSVRRKPNLAALKIIIAIYKKMLEIEKRVGTKDGMTASTEYLNNILKKENISYEKYIYLMHLNAK